MQHFNIAVFIRKLNKGKNCLCIEKIKTSVNCIIMFIESCLKENIYRSEANCLQIKIVSIKIH